MICLSDNDIILKLACCDLLAEAMTVLGVDAREVFVLPSAKYVLLKPRSPEKAIARLGITVFNRIQAFLESVSIVEVVPSANDQELLDDVLGIDAGEAVLFSATVHFPECILATSDKNSLRALSANPKCLPIQQRVAGRIICLEQIMLRIMAQFGFAFILEKVVPARDCDTALRAIFGSGLAATEENVQAGLQSYIAHLRTETGTTLMIDT